MTICLVRCPSPFLIDERAFPPLGLMAVGAGLRDDGYDVVLYDGDTDYLPLDYDAYGFGPTSPEYPHALDCLTRIKDVNPDARVVLGGPHATLLWKECSEDMWDCIVLGDGEKVAGRAFSGTETLIQAKERPLDEYPMPDRTLVDIHSYNFRLHDRPTTTVMGSRGCPYKCSFCCKNNTRVRLNSAARMIAEIQLLHDDYGYRAIAFPEDIFILNKHRTTEVCRYLAKTDILWRCLVRADLVVQYGGSFLDMMIDAGCVGVGIGIESGSDTILKNIHKGETAEQMRQAIWMLKERKLFVKGFFIIGLPGESEETLAETERFLREARLNDIDCKIFQPYPGSPIGDHPELYDIRWEAVPLEYTFYKGRPGDYYGNISTSALSNERIVEAWKHFEETYKDWSFAEEGQMVVGECNG